MANLKTNLVKLLKGIAIGVAVIIPGVSASTLAVLLGIYDDLLEAFGGFKKHFKKTVLTLLPLGIGALIGFIAFWYPLIWIIQAEPIPTMAVFAGFILGGFPGLFERIRGRFKPYRVLLMIGTALIGIAIGACSVLFKLDTSYLFIGIDFWGCFSLLLVGLLVASAMFIPGVSGTMLLIAMGFWDPISSFFRNLIAFTDIGVSLLYIGFFLLGNIVGLLAFSKLLTRALKNHNATVSFAIIGFVFGSIVSAFYNYDVVVTYQAYQMTGIGNYIRAGLLLIVGIAVGYVLTTREKKKHEKDVEI
ncbi:MAG: DUF368 domain-containing protein [Firmicutes bacterium]|nr:DUF368 domain-containing protein [Bacillota bacterium]